MRPALALSAWPGQSWQSWLGAAAAGLLLGCGLASAAQASAPQDLAGQYGCMSCHGMVRKQVGPGFAQVAARYRGDAQALARLTAKIRSGSVGSWGRVIMPRQPQVSEADAQMLARWVLSQPPPP